MTIARAETSHVSEQQMTDEAKWKLLFSTFLQTPVAQLDLEVNVTAESILLATADRQVAERLLKILNSPQRLRASLDYTLTESKAVANKDIAEVFYPPAIKLAHGIGTQVYPQIFGEAALRDYGFFEWTGEVDRDDCFVLKGNCGAEEDFTLLKIAKYKEILSSATFEDLRNALSSELEHYKPLTNRRQKAGVLAKHIDKIIYPSNDNTQIFFDYGLLINCTQAPAMTIVAAELEEKSPPRYEIRIDKTHLINYFSMVFPEGFVMNVNGNEGTPIVFSMKRAMPLKHVISLVLDCSGSMAASRESYLAHVKNFIKKISQQEEYKDAEVRVTHFASYSHLETYQLSDLTNLLAYISGLMMTGGTELNAALSKELTALLTRSKSNENVTVVTFTDGVDDGLPQPLKDLAATMGQINKKHGARPRTFAMALGEYDTTKLTALTEMTGGALITLKAMDDFKKIFDHLTEMGRVTEFMTFVQQNMQFVTPGYTNELCVSGRAITLPGDFSVNNTAYHVEKGALQLVERAMIAPPLMSEPVAGKADFVSLLAGLDANARMQLLALLQQDNKPANVTQGQLSAPKRGGLFNQAELPQTKVAAVKPETQLSPQL
jgi:uncharacterized protein YegL